MASAIDDTKPDGTLPTTSSVRAQFTTAKNEITALQAYDASLSLTTTGNGASLIGVEDSAANFTGTDVEAVLAEIISTYAAVTTGNGSAKIGSEDAGGFFSGATVEAILQEIGQHIISVQKFISIPLYTLRETTNFDVGAIAANGGVLASDTTPALDAINAATDGCQRVLWAASNNDQVTTQVTLPPDLDPSANLILHCRIVSGGTTDAVGFTVDSFFNEGDTKVTDTSGTNQTTTWAEVTTTIAAADVPVGAQTLTLGLTPVAHTTDTLAMSAIWIEYTGTLRTS